MDLTDAIILVGGQGTRLRPLTAKRHKSLVPVRNVPAIEHLFRWLEREGVQRAVLAIGQGNEDLANAYRNGRRGALAIDIVEEPERLESGGAIRYAVAEAGINDRFLVLNGDVYLDFDLRAALAQHVDGHADLTLALYAVAEPWLYGVAVTDAAGMVTDFVEKPPRGSEPGNLVNAGAWIFERTIVDEIPAGAVRVEETFFPSLVAQRRTVLGFEFGGTWADIGTPERYLTLNRALLEASGGGADVEGAEVHPSASVRLSSLGQRSRVAARAVIEGSILWEDVEVGEGARVRGSIIADGARVGAGASLTGAVVAAGESIGAGAVVAGPGV